MKKWRLDKAQLYLILDAEVIDYEKMMRITPLAIKGGVDIIQLRDKRGTSRDVCQIAKKLCSVIQGKIPFIVNDRVDIALAAGADGVHIGQEDLPLKDVRKIVGPDFLIGVSCQKLHHLPQAQKEADYIGFGSVFKTLTKPDRQPMDLGLLQKAWQQSGIPLFAVGGITRKNIRQLTDRGISKIAICREICLAEDVYTTCAYLKEILLKAKKSDGKGNKRLLI